MRDGKRTDKSFFFTLGNTAYEIYVLIPCFNLSLKFYLQSPISIWKLTVFLELRSRKIMSADKYPSIFSRQTEAIVYISHAGVIAIFSLPLASVYTKKIVKCSMVYHKRHFHNYFIPCMPQKIQCRHNPFDIRAAHDGNVGCKHRIQNGNHIFWRIGCILYGMV